MGFDAASVDDSEPGDEDPRFAVPDVPAFDIPVAKYGSLLGDVSSYSSVRRAMEALGKATGGIDPKIDELAKSIGAGPEWTRPARLRLPPVTVDPTIGMLGKLVDTEADQRRISQELVDGVRELARLGESAEKKSRLLIWLNVGVLLLAAVAIAVSILVSHTH